MLLAILVSPAFVIQPIMNSIAEDVVILRGVVK